MPAFTRRITGSDAVRSVMGGLGLEAPSSIAGSADAVAKQMWILATDVGQKLVDEHPWQVLSAEHTITTLLSVTEYPLPSDFSGYESDSFWNRTTQRPALGSMDEFEWQALKARTSAGTPFSTLIKIEDDKVILFDEPPAGQVIVLPYRSRGWVLSAASERKDNLSNDDDTILFDPQLFKSGLRLAWLGAKGFDTTKARMEYGAVLGSTKAKDSPKRTLSMSPLAGFPYLGAINIPDTGYGS